MNNKKQTKQPLFAEVNLTGEEFRKSPSTHMQRTRFLKLVYPNGVTLINNEKHRTVKHYIIEYRSIDTGIPIFLTTPGKGSGRGKEVIQSQLSEWNGLALMCDIYKQW